MCGVCSCCDGCVSGGYEYEVVCGCQCKIKLTLNMMEKHNEINVVISWVRHTHTDIHRDTRTEGLAYF